MNVRPSIDYLLFTRHIKHNLHCIYVNIDYYILRVNAQLWSALSSTFIFSFKLLLKKIIITINYMQTSVLRSFDWLNFEVEGCLL